MKKKRLLRDLGILLVLFIGAWVFFIYYPVDDKEEIVVAPVVDKEASIKEKLIELMHFQPAGSDNSELMKALGELQNLVKDSEIEYQLYLSNSSDINTYSLLGNMIVLNRGLIKMCDTPEELIGIIAHGIGHLKHNHNKEEFIKSLEIKLLLEENNASITEVSELLNNNLYSVENEIQADDYAISKMKELNISPHYMVYIFKKLYLKSDKIPEFLSTHPGLNQRIAKLSKFKEVSSEREYGFDWNKAKASL